jgi:hypothetical protein
MSTAAGVPAGPGPDSGGPEMRIDRLAVRVTGLDEAQARTLARLVAEGITPGLPELAGGDLGRVRLRVSASAAQQGRPELLAGLIASELSRVLGLLEDPGYPGREAAW